MVRELRSSPALVYVLCLASSVTCTGLLIRSYARNRTGLLLWSALGFVALSFNNLFLVLGLVVFPTSTSCSSVTSLLIPEQAAPLFRNDGAPLFRSIAAQRSDQSSPTIPG